MSTISFSTKPQKKYYAYKDDGCIYSISSTEPTARKAEGGGVFYCYFKCVPYGQKDDNVYLLYRKNATDSYEAVSSTSFYNGEIYYINVNNVYESYDVVSNGYYTKNGATKYECPNSASNLPHIDYTDKEGVKSTYYVDNLIGNGDVYGNDGFTPLNIDDGDVTTTTTYGSLLLDDVKESITINAFTSCVSQLPVYLTGDDLSKEYKAEGNVEYNVPADYLVVYGKLFIEKLNLYMKSYGDDIIEKYASAEIATTYKKAVITHEETENTGTLTTTSSTSYSSVRTKKSKQKSDKAE